ncbi:carboxypeptidase regulatory-like domain-containing protein [Desertifilum sp. FACHB-1129]|uniref:SD-repeat containing protein B domain-containing protein n=1 Tax=Desertifilum tharense IPPAS B-1220 TaxID=1781255 RepID=A0A1E5QIK6_9CYAN|nr:MULTISPECIES: SdrD B-like domain-containing protein [Desertifilum]MDA0210100.1 carboxypeptidase regulatory-like domain-containing protein [Cyanobacteria bacterium FC1]MDK3155826.1 SdrD B-like domain-containing protein [Kamptonema cortianum]MBD2312594.1 carboxypeptidase regulatory-like domain-containing protein [Desertifilum sp. FACHB-1129]MBD2320506.1 carboxypeptidase regulatory-like domain-containing protein [Desertifilum sp. FACHB-866]MBD2330634.1 carboxypeptidase regulatory-like domain-c
MALNFSNVNFGNTILLGSISGIKFNDLNSNGIFDPGEPPIPNVQIFLDLDGSGVPSPNNPTTLTGPQGSYSFVGLPPGNYAVREVAPLGFIQTTPSPNVTLAPGQNLVGINFGNVQPVGSIAGTKFNDLNGNGILDPGEPPIAGVSVFLDLDNNGVLSPNDPVFVTDAQGIFGFGGLPAGTYVVREVVPPGFQQTTPSPTVNLAPGQNVGVLIGNAPLLGSISGVKFNDLNSNGVFDPGEPPIAGVQIFLDLDGSGAPSPGDPVTVTDAQGNYGFSGLPAGNYAVREVVPSGFAQTTPSPNISLAPGQNVVGANFGNAALLGSITGVKFNDLNANGLFDAGEPPIAGVQIFLDLDGSGAPSPGEPTTVTDAQGNYGFFGLPAGNYAVREVAPSGFVQTTANPNISLAPGQNVGGVNFGNFLPQGSIAGTKFNDLNGNGIREPNDPPIAGVQIFLDLNNDGLLNAGEPVAITDQQGVYGFAGLPPGTYTVREVVPPGFAQTTPSPTVTLAPGQNLGIDFGNRPLLGSISGIKFNDLNANALLDPGEPPIPGVTIYLDLNANGTLDANEPSTVTNEQGAYSFQGLTPGTYIVREIQPPGFVQTTPDPVVTIDPFSGASNFDFLTGSFT